MPKVIKPYIEGWLNVAADGHCGFQALSFCKYSDEIHWLRVRQDIIEELTTYRDLYIRLCRGGKCSSMNYQYSLSQMTIHFIFMFYFIGGEEEYLKRLDSLDCKLSIAPQDKWLDLTNMGLAIATAYQVVITCYWKSLSCVYYPLEWRGFDDHLPSPPTAEWALGLAGDHFFILHMKDDAPIRYVPREWAMFRDPAVQCWEEYYEWRHALFVRG